MHDVLYYDDSIPGWAISATPRPPFSPFSLSISDLVSSTTTDDVDHNISRLPVGNMSKIALILLILLFSSIVLSEEGGGQNSDVKKEEREDSSRPHHRFWW